MQVTLKSFKVFVRKHSQQIIDITDTSDEDLIKLGLLDKYGRVSSNVVRICYVYKKNMDVITHRIYLYKNIFYIVQKPKNFWY